MRERAGLPIAAHLALLVALASAAAFVLCLGVVIWLPPRPPDVMAGEEVIERFTAGFHEMRAAGRLPRDEGMRWTLRAQPPTLQEQAPGDLLRGALAGRLNLSQDKIAVAARLSRTDVFVFRVRTGEAGFDEEAERVMELRTEEFRRHIEERAERIERQAERFERFIPRPPEGHGIVPPPPPVDMPEPPEPPAPPDPPLFAPPPGGVVLLSGFQIAAQLPDGKWLTMSEGRNWEETWWIARAAGMIGVTLLVLMALALFFARRLAQPIRAFSDAVQAVGVNPHGAPAPETGPRELQGAARAVNAMQARLRTLIADRTQTLASVAHDMRTPLMRLRLAAEDVAPEQRERMAKEIGEVEALVASFIAFARDDPAEEARARIDLSSLVQSLVDDHAASGRDATFEGEDRVIITGQSLGLKRLFNNLIENALKYGTRARVRLRQEGGLAIVEIEDDGPGVPEDQRESVFRPFVRLAAGGGGAGLGLPSARSIARAHGGDITILASGKGALLRTTLPL